MRKLKVLNPFNPQKVKGNKHEMVQVHVANICMDPLNYQQSELSCLLDISSFKEQHYTNHMGKDWPKYLLFKTVYICYISNKLHFKIV